MSTDTVKAILTPNTKVTLGAVTSIIATAFTVFIWLDRRLDKIEGAITMNNISITNLFYSQWSVTDQEIFALRLKVSNPNLSVPEVREIATGRSKPKSPIN